MIWEVHAPEPQQVLARSNHQGVEKFGLWQR